MRRAPRQKAIYQRGSFRLYRRPGRANLEVVLVRLKGPTRAKLFGWHK